MDWITFIKWNGIVYSTYYGANLLVDFLRTKGEFSNASGPVQYSLKGLDNEKPRLVKSSDFSPGKQEQVTRREGTTNKKRNNPNNQISFGAPIERQAIPIDEFIKIAGKSGNQVFQPTI